MVYPARHRLILAPQKILKLSTHTICGLPRRAERSFQADLLGYATFNLVKQRFTKFDLVALGSQQGGGERSSPSAVPIGVALTLATDAPMERVEPLRLEMYGWR